MAVLSPNGAKIGYLRKTLAATIVPRLEEGTEVMAEVAHVLPEEFQPDSGINIEVRLVSGFSNSVKITTKETLPIMITKLKGDSP